MSLKLTPQNQLQRLYEDIERLNDGRRADFSLGQHIELLIKRVSALEAASTGKQSSDGGMKQ